MRDRDPTLPTMRTEQWAWLALLSLLWGCAFLFTKVALRDIPVFSVALGRTGIAAVLLLALVALGANSLWRARHRWREFLVLGALRGAIPITLMVWAQTRIDAGVAAILNSTSPLFTMVAAHVLTRDDRFTLGKLLGCGVGMVGVGIMVGGQALHSMNEQVLGQLAILAACCSYGLAAVYGRRFSGLTHATSAAGMLTGASVLILPMALLESPWTLTPAPSSLAALTMLAVLSTALGFIVWFRLIQTAGPSNTSLVAFGIPIVALALGFVVLGEHPTLSSLLGLSAILGGLALSQAKWPSSR